jgi:hypothetical protein
LVSDDFFKANPSAIYSVRLAKNYTLSMDNACQKDTGLIFHVIAECLDGITYGNIRYYRGISTCLLSR